MSQRVDTGTDIAMIGIWDPAHERHDLKDASFARKDAGYHEEAKEGRLFYVNTGADGSFPIEFFVNEPPPAELLELYSAVARPFLIVCESGRLMAGGLEDFTSPTKQITTSADEMRLSPGRYALELHRLDSDKLETDRARVIGVDDLEYYRRRWKGLPWGWFLFALAPLLGLCSIYLAIAVYLLWAIYLFWRSRRLSLDARYHEISKRVEEYEDRLSGLIIALRPLREGEELAGGWLDWDAIDPDGSLE